MPNHCHNDLYIHGSADNVAALLKHIGADQTPPKFDFNAVLPYPAELKKLDDDMEKLGGAGFEDKYGKGAKDGFNSGGYEWRVANWDTKWNSYQVVHRDYMGKCLTFQTAWSPPEKVIQALHRMFPECSLHFEYFECGMAACGGFSCLSAADHYDDELPWAAGQKTSEWRGRYCGNRGG